MVWQAAGDGTLLAGRLTPGPASPTSGGALGPSLLCAGLLLWGQVSLQGPQNPSANGEVLGDAAEEGLGTTD